MDQLSVNIFRTDDVGFSARVQQCLRNSNEETGDYFFAQRWFRHWSTLCSNCPQQGIRHCRSGGQWWFRITIFRTKCLSISNVRNQELTLERMDFDGSLKTPTNQDGLYIIQGLLRLSATAKSLWEATKAKELRNLPFDIEIVAEI